MNYSYGNSDWKDLLTEYNGTAINYDLSGNPLNWRNASSLTWDGRRLSGMTLTDGTELAFEYNSAGIRIGKTVGSDKTVEYLLDGTKIIREIRKVNGTVTETLLYYYNTDGDVIGLNYNGTDYYYGRNMQGDILYIYNTSGEAVTTYAYDAWGSIVSQTGTLSSTVGEANPFRYRGYYLDSETGLYYLQSRYYDVAVGRFLNADEVLIVGATDTLVSTNLFSYCENCPILHYDETGHLVISRAVSVGIGAILGIGISVAYIRDLKGNAYIVASLDFTISTSVGVGFGIQYGIFWRYKTVDDFLKKQTRSHSVGKIVGVDFHEEVEEFNSKGLAGMGLSLVTGLSFTTASYGFFVWEIRRGFVTVALRSAPKWIKIAFS